MVKSILYHYVSVMHSTYGTMLAAGVENVSESANTKALLPACCVKKIYEEGELLWYYTGTKKLLT